MSEPTKDDPGDVADEEAEAIAAETSTEQVKPDDRLTAPTTDDPS